MTRKSQKCLIALLVGSVLSSICSTAHAEDMTGFWIISKRKAGAQQWEPYGAVVVTGLERKPVPDDRNGSFRMADVEFAFKVDLNNPVPRYKDVTLRTGKWLFTEDSTHSLAGFRRSGELRRVRVGEFVGTVKRNGRVVEEQRFEQFSVPDMLKYVRAREAHIAQLLASMSLNERALQKQILTCQSLGDPVCAATAQRDLDILRIEMREYQKRLEKAREFRKLF